MDLMHPADQEAGPLLQRPRLVLNPFVRLAPPVVALVGPCRLSRYRPSLCRRFPHCNVPWRKPFTARFAPLAPQPAYGTLLAFTNAKHASQYALGFFQMRSMLRI
jgi:hypothetical protein